MPHLAGCCTCRAGQGTGTPVPHSFEGKAGRREERHNRRLAQFVIRLPDIKDVSTDLSCDGCSVVDNRVEVVNGAVYPYSAVGQLLGQLRGSIKCVFPSVCPNSPLAQALANAWSALRVRKGKGHDAANRKIPRACVRVDMLSEISQWSQGLTCPTALHVHPLVVLFPRAPTPSRRLPFPERLIFWLAFLRVLTRQRAVMDVQLAIL